LKITNNKIAAKAVKINPDTTAIIKSNHTGALFFLLSIRKAIAELTILAMKKSMTSDISTVQILQGFLTTWGN